MRVSPACVEACRESWFVFVKYSGDEEVCVEDACGMVAAFGRMVCGVGSKRGVDFFGRAEFVGETFEGKAQSGLGEYEYSVQFLGRLDFVQLA